jgi:hypothetical protein
MSIVAINNLVQVPPILEEAREEPIPRNEPLPLPEREIAPVERRDLAAERPRQSPWYKTAAKIALGTLTNILILPVSVIAVVAFNVFFIVLLPIPRLVLTLIDLTYQTQYVSKIASACERVARRMLQSVTPNKLYIYTLYVMLAEFTYELSYIAFNAKYNRIVIEIDPALNQNNFQKALIDQAIPDLPAGVSNEHYRNLAAICQKFSPDDPEILGVDRGELSTGIHLWIYRMDHKTRFLMVPPGEEGEKKYYAKLIQYMNHLTLFFETENPSNEHRECAKDFLKRLQLATISCATRWMSEAETMYRDSRGQTAYPSIEDWVHGNDAAFRRGLIEEQNERGNTHFFNNSLHHINKMIKVPGGAEALVENWGPHPSHFQAEFFLKYRANRLVEHFLELANGSFIERPKPDGSKEWARVNVEVDREKLLDWFRQNEPESYQGENFLEEVMYVEDEEKFRSGDFKSKAIHYLLFKCGILTDQPTFS